MFKWLKECLGKNKGGFDVKSYCKGRNDGRREIRENSSEAGRALAKRRRDRTPKRPR